MLCPTCKARLKIAHQHGVVIDFCTRCWGVWLGRYTLDTILHRSSAAFAAPTPPRQPLRHRRTTGCET